MHILAAILSIFALMCFLGAAYFGSPPNPSRRIWHLGWLGLAFLTTAWMVQVIWVSGNHLSVH